MSRILLAAGLALYGAQAFAANISFTGVFSTDDQLQQFNFTLASGATVTLQTWSYAGGTNANSAVIPQGGFDPWLSLYDSLGNLLQSVDNGTCGQVGTDSVTGACFDSFISQPLGTGSYILILSQSDNQPAGTMLSDGFTQTGSPTFTSSFGCTNGQFCDSNADNRTNEWAVDIDNVTSAFAVSAVPEPGTIVLLASGLAAIMLRRRKLRV
ncbi:MAG TPA: DVUA0089 family protein [Bryobacteraceae bacterium]|nr:DVUA0089 family protein [Bryobacteraceae bacterium]